MFGFRRQHACGMGLHVFDLCISSNLRPRTLDLVAFKLESILAPLPSSRFIFGVNIMSQRQHLSGAGRDCTPLIDSRSTRLLTEQTPRTCVSFLAVLLSCTVGWISPVASSVEAHSGRVSPMFDASLNSPIEGEASPVAVMSVSERAVEFGLNGGSPLDSARALSEALELQRAGKHQDAVQ